MGIHLITANLLKGTEVTELTAGITEVIAGVTELIAGITEIAAIMASSFFKVTDFRAVFERSL